MTLRRKKTGNGTHQRTINIDGDDIKITHVGFECSDDAWMSFQKIMLKKYKGNIKMKSHAMRILVNAVNLGIINLDDLEKKCYEKAEHVEELVYI